MTEHGLVVELREQTDLKRKKIIRNIEHNSELLQLIIVLIIQKCHQWFLLSTGTFYSMQYLGRTIFKKKHTNDLHTV